MDLLTKKDLNREEYLLAHVLFIFNMKKLGGEKITKIMQNEDTRNAFKEFFNLGQFLFALPAGSDSVTFQTDVPTLDKLKVKKVVLIIRAKPDRNVDVTDQNVSKEIIMMAVTQEENDEFRQWRLFKV